MKEASAASVKAEDNVDSFKVSNNIFRVLGETIGNLQQIVLTM
ncbi:hypothetical protein [Paenibacillus pseudetheri]|nr:hypothetical protein [Paenibacillus pseudetheri]